MTNLSYLSSFRHLVHIDLILFCNYIWFSLCISNLLHFYWHSKTSERIGLVGRVRIWNFSMRIQLIKVMLQQWDEYCYCFKWVYFLKKKFRLCKFKAYNKIMGSFWIFRNVVAMMYMLFQITFSSLEYEFLFVFFLLHYWRNSMLLWGKIELLSWL